MILNRDETIDAFRKAVLGALDKAAGETIKDGAHGWVDQELPRFFKALDAQIESVAARYNVTLVDPPVEVAR